MALKNTQPLGDAQFIRGNNSNLDPTELTDGFYRFSFNLANRGGIAQTRPGLSWKFNLPPGRRLQGAHLFRPLNDLEHILVAVDGIIYASPYPFVEYAPVNGITFSAEVEDIFFVTAEKSVVRNEDGSLTLVPPFKVAIIQDGVTAPGVWDGSTARHLTESNETPIGTHMLWTSDRLWVARDRELFVGDINDPTGNNEGTYISNAKSFLLDRPITALAEVTYSSGSSLLAFTDSSGVAFRSDIRRRADWSDPELQFQRPFFPNIGCLAHRSVVTRNGLLHWWSQHGWTNLNAAMSAQQTSEIRYLDTEMADSKGRLSPDQSGVAAAAFENYLVVSVPSGDTKNAHTWVSDAGPAETRGSDSPEAWNGVWTGTRPVEWMTGVVQGKDRIYHASIDLDGTFRVWEAFTDERTDNGCPIQWSLESRGYTGGTLADKEMRFAEVFLSELRGTVDIAVFWAGTSRGAFKKILSVRLIAEEGILHDAFEMIDDTELFNLKKQTRRIRTKDIKMSFPIPAGCEVESDIAERIDVGHQLRIVGSGECAIRMIRVTTSTDLEDDRRDCTEDEDGEINMVRFDGFASKTLAGFAQNPEEVFESEQDYTLSVGVEEYVGVGEAVSLVSQKDADKVAECRAKSDANEWYKRTAPIVEFDPENPYWPSESGGSS